MHAVHGLRPGSEPEYYGNQQQYIPPGAYSFPPANAYFSRDLQTYRD